MTAQTITRSAAKLTPGDRIAAGFLPTHQPAEVLYRTEFSGKLVGEVWAVVVYRYDDGPVGVDYFLADADIRLESAADPTGLAYTRADSDADDPTPVSPARVPLHTGFHEATVTGGE